MPSPENEIDLFEEIRRGRARMEWEWRFRQENLLPMETAYNEGRFYGLLLKGDRPLSPAQRIGVLALALWGLLSPGMVYIADKASLLFSSERFSDLDLIVLLSTLPYALVGVRLVWVSFKLNSPRSESPAQR